MRSTMALITLCVALATPAVRAQDATPVAKAVAPGEKVFADQKCIVCHSIGAIGNKKGPLDGMASKYSSAELHQWIVDAPAMAAKAKSVRKPAMKAYTLPKDDLESLVAYLMTLPAPKK